MLLGVKGQQVNDIIMEDEQGSVHQAERPLLGHQSCGGASVYALRQGINVSSAATYGNKCAGVMPAD